MDRQRRLTFPHPSSHPERTHPWRPGPDCTRLPRTDPLHLQPIRTSPACRPRRERPQPVAARSWDDSASPLLYAGYIGLAVPFAFAVAVLLEGRIEPAWLRWSRPWTNIAWALLTLGIALGSWWAYYELGWGGWWFWDPVENASFMPWLIGVALIHSQADHRRTRQLHPLDTLARNHRLCTSTAWHIPRPLKRTDLSPCLCC